MMPPPKKKGKGGLIAIISIIVVVVIIGGVVAALAFGGKNKPGTTTNSSTPASAATPTPTATPTPSVPSGFQQFSGDGFTISYPSDWTTKASSGSKGEDFNGPEGQVFQVLIQPNGDSAEIPTFLDTLCSIFGKPIGSPTTVTIGGQQWQQETCGNNGTPVGAVDATVYQGQLFSIDYFSLATDFASDKTQFYAPMEQSFAFTVNG
jgi:hypothetical protein